MKRLLCCAHQRHNICDRRKLVSTMRSASVSVVEDIAPICTMASMAPPCSLSQPPSCSGTTRSRKSSLLMLRHLKPERSRSQITTGTPRSASAAARFEPIKPAPPVTRIILKRTPGSAFIIQENQQHTLYRSQFPASDEDQANYLIYVWNSRSHRRAEHRSDPD